jgi:creatinine amidohydrolase
VDTRVLLALGPAGIREQLGDGNFGGAYYKPDERVLEMWQVGVEETRRRINDL